MPFTATVLKEPMGAWTTFPHFIVDWFAKYANAFTNAEVSASPQDYYASSATLVNPDKSTVSGAQQIWDYCISLYRPAEKCTREVISMILLTENQSGRLVLHVEVTTQLHSKKDLCPVQIPQAFVYEIAEAESGCGTDGLQIWGIRCYFDKGLLENHTGKYGEGESMFNNT